MHQDTHAEKSQDGAQHVMSKLLPAFFGADNTLEIIEKLFPKGAHQEFLHVAFLRNLAPQEFKALICILPRLVARRWVWCKL